MKFIECDAFVVIYIFSSLSYRSCHAQKAVFGDKKRAKTSENKARSHFEQMSKVFIAHVLFLCESITERERERERRWEWENVWAWFLERVYVKWWDRARILKRKNQIIKAAQEWKRIDVCRWRQPKSVQKIHTRDSEIFIELMILTVVESVYAKCRPYKFVAGAILLITATEQNNKHKQIRWMKYTQSDFYCELVLSLKQ